MIIKNLIYCALITLIAFCTPALADYNIVGDANNDGIITTADSLLALQMSVGSIVSDPEIADVNADGKVNSPDALMMLMMAQKAQVRVDTPEVVSGTFNAMIDIYNVADLDSGQFDLSFDASVVNVTGVNSGTIDGTEVPIDAWELIDPDTIRVLFNLPDTTGISGSGSLATISFEILGVVDDTSVLAIFDGLLVDIESNEISSLWFNDEITVGIPVTVNAPEVVSGTFDAMIDIADITNLDSGQFDLSFDASVVNVTSVNSGSIDGTEVPIDMWRFLDTDTIRVIFNLPDTTGVSGSGSLTTISFEVLGVVDDTSILAISDGLLVDIESNEIFSLWFDDGITVGAPVTVNAPKVVSGTFDAMIDIADITNLDSGQFDLSFDASVVNVTSVNSGSIDGTEVPIDMWRFLDTDTIRVIFNLPDTTGVSGSGSLTTISFEVLGVTDDTSILAISDGLLVDIESNEIFSLWFDDGITVGAPVTVNAPKVVSGTFDAMIDIADITNLDSGQFDLSFDASVVNVTSVNSGSIDGTEVPIDMWRFIDPDTIRVIFNLPDTTGVSGSGSLTTISFEVLGVTDDTSILAISDGLLVDIESNEIFSLWFNDEITVGIPVTFNAPEVVSGTFDAMIDIADITNLDSGQFDLSFDASVVNVTSVDSGSIDGTEVPIDMWRFLDTDTIRVIFNLPDTTGVSGSGSLTTISFEVLGVTDDTSILAISDGLLVDIESNEIFSLWFDDEITVGAPVTVNAPKVVSGTFDAMIDIADITNLDSGQFDLSFDASVVNVTGVNSGSINGTEVPIDEWDFIDPDTIRVLFNLPGTTGVSGSGSLTIISFEVLGVTDDTSILAISDGLLVDTESNEISSVWSDDEITVEIPVEVPVTVNAPEVVSGTFDATIDIADITNLDSGQFDLSFDASVVNVTSVNSGSIDGTEVPIDMWRFLDTDTIRVIFNLPNTTGVSGSGSLATISFEVLGVTDDTSILAISDGLLVDIESNEIFSLWFNDEITVGIPVTFNAPEVVSGTFDAMIDIADITNLDSGQFDLSFDASVVNVTGVNSGSIDGTEVPIDMWRFLDTDTIRVIFNLPNTTGVSGSGSLATISFDVLGVTDDTSVLAISDGLLVDIESNEISSLWFDDGITVEVPVDVPVTVNAPEVVTNTFDATIDIADVTNLDSGEFDLSFDASVVNVTGVNSGSINGTEVPIDEWDFIDPDTIRVLFNISGTTGVSGSGSLATISFEVLGVTDDTSILAISDGLLVDTESNEISSLWSDDEITLDVPVDVPVTVNAPEVVTDTFDATIDIADVTNLDSGEFDLSFDASVVNVTGVNSGSIDGTDVPIDEWDFIDPDTIRVLFNLPGTTGVSGSGSLATISFDVLGVTDDTSILAISDGLLVDIESNEIFSLWSDDEITVEVPVDVIVGVPVTVNAPEVVTGTFDATIDIADVTDLDSGQFDLSFDASVVNVIGVDSGIIGSTTVQLETWTLVDSDTVRVCRKISYIN